MTFTKENPTPCWISDYNANPDKKHKLALIIGRRGDNQYYIELQTRPTSWKYAEPLTQSELEEFGLAALAK